MIQFAQYLFIVLAIYIVLGTAFAIWFAFFRIEKFDEAAKDTSIGFRVLMIPGAVAFWWLLLIRILRNHPQPTESTAHRTAALR